MSKNNKFKKFIIILLIIILLVVFLLYINHNSTDTEYMQGNSTIDSNNNIDNSKYNEVSSSNKNTGTIKERLEKLSEDDSRFKTIINDYNSYPETLLDMLSRNKEMLDYVLGYKEKNGKVYSQDIGKVNKGEVPLLLQWDERWGYGKYGEDNVAISGCAPTSLAMVIAGLKGDNKVTPYDVAKYAENNGFYLEGTGTSWDLMTDGSKHFGIVGEVLTLSKKAIFNELDEGHPIICSVRAGDFTTQGHFIVLTAVKDGKIKINDPNSIERSNILWDYERIEYQIKNLWVFRLK